MQQCNLFSSTFISAFSKLSQAQRFRYLDDQAGYICRLLFDGEQKGSSLWTDSVIQVPIHLEKSKLFGCFVSKPDNFILNAQEKVIKITHKKIDKTYDLKNYLSHFSRRTPKKLTLLYIGSNPRVPQLDRKVQFTLDESICKKIYLQTWKCSLYYRNEELQYLVSSSGILNQASENQQNVCVFLKPESLQKVMINRMKAIEQSRNIMTKWVTLYLKKNPTGQSLEIYQNRSKLNIFKLQAFYKKSKQTVLSDFINYFQAHKSNSSMFLESNLIEQSQRGQYRAVYQKLSLQGNLHQMIFLQEILNQQPEFLYIEAIENIVFVNFMEKMVVSISDCKGGTFLKIFCEFNQTVEEDLAREYLTKLSELTFGAAKDKSDIKFQMNSIQHFPMIEEDIYVSFVEGDQTQEQMYSICQDPSFLSYNETESLEKQKLVTYQNQLLMAFNPSVNAANSLKGSETHETEADRTNDKRYFYQLKPIIGYNLAENRVTRHFIFQEWRRSKKGGVVCTNQATIKKHRTVFKQILTSLGNSILKGGNILNVSLPVTIFKKQSYLQLLGRSFAYAPLFLEGDKSPVQMIKWATLLSVTVGSLGISMDKPFLPFLGETTQCWIGGCPMYLQQIQRYPPTTAYCFWGRGYRIHGQVSPKINFGLNCVKGSSQNPCYVSFDDGREYQISYPYMVISGLLIGDRNYNFHNKIFVYDKVNHIFSELSFGPRSNSIFSSNQEPDDFIHGKIYQLTPHFLKQFESTIPRQYPSKQHIVRQLCSFEGTWNGKVFFDREQYIDFQTQLPNVVEEEPHPIKSDSCFRPEITKLIQGDIEQSQILKEKAEQEQKRDRKLRAREKKHA